jgi:hypothetical protein
LSEKSITVGSTLSSPRSFTRDELLEVAEDGRTSAVAPDEGEV